MRILLYVLGITINVYVLTVEPNIASLFAILAFGAGLVYEVGRRLFT
jgi:hypothetical protein